MAESAGNEQIFHLFFTVCVILCYNTYGDIMSYNNPFPYSDDNKRYHTWNYYLKHRFHSEFLLSQPGWHLRRRRLHLLQCPWQR